MTKKESLYFLAVIPNKEVCEQVMAYKKLVHDEFGSKAALRSPAHITLHMPFKWRNDREGILMEKLGNFNFSDFPLEVELNGFGFFAPRVVFIKVRENEMLRNLQKELSRYIRRELNIFNADYKDKPFHPHMTVAFRDLKKSIFPEVEAFFSEKAYQTNFQVNQICLLKHDTKVWNEHQYFPPKTVIE